MKYYYYYYYSSISSCLKHFKVEVLYLLILKILFQLLATNFAVLRNAEKHTHTHTRHKNKPIALGTK